MGLGPLAPYQAVALFNPFDHFAFFAGTGAGKTHTGARFAIKMFTEYPDVPGFIGANTYDQLSQVTLRELFEQLDEVGYEYVIDRIPPPHWGEARKYKKYSNIISVRIDDGRVAYAFTRVLGKGNPLRGLQFGWYWIDETRDTPRNTFDIILSRMRRQRVRKGLVTTTTNGEDWTWRQFVQRADHKTFRFGSMHVSTRDCVAAGIVEQAYLDTMLASYSPLMAAQEIEAQHVNVTGSVAYHSAGQHNRQRLSPWGTYYPRPEDGPLIIGCDFNYSPAPMVWEIGQLGPVKMPNGRIETGIHWFGEVSEVAISTEDMAKRVLQQWPGFFYRFFGDASGTKGTTSNAGMTDVIHIQNVCTDAGVLYSVDFDQANPFVKDRVENVCRCLRNGLGETLMTYNQDMCPLLDGDLRLVGWRQPQGGQSRHTRPQLDTGGDPLRTHGSDGMGYAMWKLFPFTGQTRLVGAISRMGKDLY